MQDDWRGEAAKALNEDGRHVAAETILALIDKPAPDHSADACNMIDKGAG